MAESLRDMAAVAADLMAKGASDIRIANGTLRVSVPGPMPAGASPPQVVSQIVNVAQAASATATANARVEFEAALQAAIDRVTDPEGKRELESKMGELRNSALAGRATHKTVLDAAKWMLSFGKDTFVALAPSLLKLLITGTLS